MNSGTICLAAIVCNEQHVIARMLRSIRQQIDAWIIADTGSTDDTPAAILRELGDVQPGRLVHDTWRDFGSNRTVTLEHARPLADWLLVLDADETLEGTIPPLDPNVTSYRIEVASKGGMRWESVRLMRADLNWRYAGTVHAIPVAEQPDENPAQLPGVRIVHHDDGGMKAGRRERNRRLLTEALAENPDDARAMFYLAQECRDDGDLAAALEHYGQRTRMEGSAEEVWYSHYQRGLMLPYGARELQQAFELRPHRLEAVHALAQLLRRDGHLHAAHLWVTYGRERVHHPVTDRLFVAQWIYEWGMLLEYATVSRLLNHKADAERATRELLLSDGLPAEVREELEATERL